jgi:large subunit ribosomal protein L1
MSAVPVAQCHEVGANAPARENPMGKRTIDAHKSFDRDASYAKDQAIELSKGMATAKFDETLEVVFKLGVDPRKAEEMLRGTVALPAGTGRDVRVAVFAQGEKATAAREAGADHVGDTDLAEAIAGGMTDFDVAIATPDMMPVVGKLGRVLGPRGLMPNPKTGTVTDDVATAVEEFKGGKVEYRTDKNGNVHVPIGKASFDLDDLYLNFATLLEELQRVKPAGAKGKYILKCVVSSTMGPGVKINEGAL